MTPSTSQGVNTAMPDTTWPRSSAGLVIIADDLTGALDASAPFAHRAERVWVATAQAWAPGALAQGAQVTAISTRSREIEASLAAARVAQVVAQLPQGRRLFKKIDSRLKGHLAAELQALPPGPLLVLPAIPGFGRVVRDGAVMGFGVDEPIPIRPLLGARGADAIIPDTETDEDIAQALAQAPEEAILVGARGLGLALARSWGGEPRAPAPLTGSVAVAVGSTDPITLAQLEALSRQGIAITPAPNGVYHGAVADESVIVLQATRGIDRANEAEVGAALARSFVPFARGRDGLILTGGATAEAVLDALAIELLAVEGEMLPGLPVSRAGSWRIVTKSGGFGAPDTLWRLLQAHSAAR